MLWLTDNIANFLGFKSTKHFKDLHSLLEGGISIYNQATDNSEYFNCRKYDLIKERFDFLTSYTSGLKGAIFIWYGNFIGLNTAKVVKEFGSIYNNLLLKKNDYNESYINLSLDKYKDYFDTRFKNPLTEEQRRAIIIDEDNNYINAGAGCGKTQTMVAKTCFLIEKKNINADEILIFAFNKKAQEELVKRLSYLGISGVEVKTFHAFGLDVFKEASKEEKHMYFDDNNPRKKFIQNVINSVVLNKNHPKIPSTLYYFAYLLEEPKDEPKENMSPGKYAKYLENCDKRSINGIYLKSQEEVKIANFLFLNSIKFTYEKKYDKFHSLDEKFHYRPDFYLEDYDIWYEHFGIDKNEDGELISGFGEKYIVEHYSKIKTHRQNKTKLISTFSYEFKKGNEYFLEHLRNLMISNGVNLKPQKKSYIISEIKKNKINTITKFADLNETFLSLIKSINKTPKELIKNEKDHRNHTFLKIFSIIFDEYNKKLGSTYIDFEDMISESTNYINKKEFSVKNYKYIMIDEFQDISLGRYKLIDSIKKKCNEAKTFCVGDDWQAIYRFNGGDVNILFEFENYFGANSKTLYLTKSFRMPKKVADITNRFIRENPLQTQKNISSYKDKKKHTIFGLFVKDHKDFEKKWEIFNAIFNAIKKRVGDKKTSILILNRYSYNDIREKYFLLLEPFKQKYKNFNIYHSSIHRQKGAEYDWVIVDDLIDSFVGFPNQMGEDSVLNMVMEKPENFDNAEERRVFYVAMTRSKKSTFLITSYDKMSSFFLEIKDEIKLFKDIEECDVCEDGIILEKTNSKTGEIFFSCNNWPYCRNSFSKKEDLDIKSTKKEVDDMYEDDLPF